MLQLRFCSASDPHVDLNVFADSQQVDKAFYQSLVGSLLYCSVCTRPDITYAVSSVARYQQDPRTVHLTAAKRILRYLKGTQRLGLCYKSDASSSLSCFCDASYASCTLTRKSTTGYLVFLGGAPVSWSSKRQTVTALSTLEAEFVAIAAATCEVIWIRGLLCSVGLGDSKPVKIYTDSRNAYSYCIKPIASTHTKHIDVKFHFVKDHLADKSIELHCVSGEDQLADYLTKPLFKPRFARLRQETGISAHENLL